MKSSKKFLNPVSRSNSIAEKTTNLEVTEIALKDTEQVRIA